MPVPIDEEWIKGMVEIGECLSKTALQHDLDIFELKVEPEFGYIHVKGSKTNDAGTKVVEVFHATQWRDLGITDIKIAPQGTAIPTGANKSTSAV